MVVRYAGAAYLVYLGIRQLRTRPNLADARAIGHDDLATVFLQGVTTNVLNPKVAPKLAQKIHEYFHPPALDMADTEPASEPGAPTVREPARGAGG